MTAIDTSESFWATAPCPSCRQLFIPAVDPHGQLIKLDPEPSADGDLALRDKGRGFTPMAYKPKPHLGWGRKLRRPHAANCVPPNPLLPPAKHRPGSTPVLGPHTFVPYPTSSIQPSTTRTTHRTRTPAGSPARPAKPLASQETSGTRSTWHSLPCPRQPHRSRRPRLPATPPCSARNQRTPMTETAEIGEWYTEAKDYSAQFLRVMRAKLAGSDRSLADVLWVAARLIPEDLTADQITGMWLITAADLLEAQDEIERLKAAQNMPAVVTVPLGHRLLLAYKRHLTMAEAVRLDERIRATLPGVEIGIADGVDTVTVIPPADPPAPRLYRPDVVVARELEAAAIRAYADRYHRFGSSHPGTTGPGEPLDPDAWCICGAAWAEGEGGCTERISLLEEAATIMRSAVAS